MSLAFRHRISQKTYIIVAESASAILIWLRRLKIIV